MKATRSILIFRAILAFVASALVAFGTAAQVHEKAPSGWVLAILITGSLGTGCIALAAWFDQSYGRATTSDVVAETISPLNLPPKVDPSAAVIAALKAKGVEDSLARTMVALDFEAAARFAKGASDAQV